MSEDGEGKGWLREIQNAGRKTDESILRCRKERKMVERGRRARDREIRVAEGNIFVAEGKKGGRGAKRLAEGSQRGIRKVGSLG